MNTSAFPSLYRHQTPPMSVEYLQPHSAGSNYTNNLSFNSSPASDVTHITTPPRSPKTCRQNGTVLLPKVRSQDQNIDPASMTANHRRNTSSMSTTVSGSFPYDFQARMPQHHRSVSPPMMNPLMSVSEFGSAINFGAAIPRSSSANRARSLSRVSNHSRSSSVSNIDDAAVRKYVCPTHRYMPTSAYMPSSTLAHVSMPPAASTAPSVLEPSSLPPLAPSFQPAPVQHTSLAPELCFENYAESPAETNLLDYLTAPNPSPDLVRRVAVPNRQFDMHFWWDVRNVRAWSDFSLDTINSIPGLTSLLEFPLPEPGLPAPTSQSVHPETVGELHDAHAAHYITKVNAALQVALGTSPLAIRANKTATAPGARAAPDFLANHPADYERTASGEPRSRVVGLVRSFDTWNTGKRTQGPAARIDFLRELAALQRHMREHHTRYGFIVTEIELVCVRLGSESVPFFGELELAPPVPLDAAGRNGSMTAPMALWYLHMLAKNAPLPGQPGWRVDVGAPAALSRQKCRARDEWMVRPEGREKRDARRNRGWVECSEPLSRKEVRPAKRK